MKSFESKVIVSDWAIPQHLLHEQSRNGWVLGAVVKDNDHKKKRNKRTRKNWFGSRVLRRN